MAFFLPRSILHPLLGGEKGVPLKLFLEVNASDAESMGGAGGCGALLFQGGCGIKVFKDKGGDRKHRQDQSKVEKLPLDEQVLKGSLVQ